MLLKHRSTFALLIILSLSLLLPRASFAAPSPSMTILSPGEGSTVASPILVSAVVRPGADNLLRITLTDNFDRVLSRQLIRVDAVNGEEINLDSQILFEIPYPGLEGLLTLATQDEYHRPLAERSVLVVLDDSGEVQVQPNPVSGQWLEISSPEPNASISGGQFVVQGTLTPVTDRPVTFELISDSGGQIGSAQLAVDQPGETIAFEITINYGFISTVRDVRLIIRQTMDSHTANIVLDSLPLTLAP
ncbi:hypothetical protein JR338_10290 [Chloroflexota bacterium]|nr:hypothetical protein JR338_10290 [Chloroflexota bacterium]